MSRLAKAVCVDPAHIEIVWPVAAPLIKKAMQRGDLGTFEGVKNDVLGAHALLWLAWIEPEIAGVAVTQISNTEGGKVCVIVACGGSGINSWVSLISAIEKYAKDEGCRCTRIFGRKGWARLLKGYRTARVVLEKDM